MVPFDVKRAVVLTAFGASFAWLNSRNAAPEPALVSSAPVRETRAQRVVAPTVAITSLHDWRPRLSEPPARSRNVFAFGAVPPKSAGSSGRAVEPAAVVTPPAPPPPPPFKLIGLAEDAGPQGSLRTAVISGAGQLFVVKDGEMVTSRYRVASVSPDKVELTDVQTGAILRLRF